MTEPERSELDLAIIDALPHMAWIADPTGHIWYVNALERGYTGRDLAWIAEHGWLALVHPDDTELAARAWQDARAGATGYVEFRLRRHDGAYRWHQHRSAAVRDADGHVQRWIGTSTDVHERHLAEDELAAARRDADERLALLDALLEHAPIGSGFLDRDLHLRKANRALVAGSGRAVEDFLGQPLSELAGNAWEALAPVLSRVVDERETVAGLAVATPDPRAPERLRHWSLGYYPIELAGELIGVGVVSVDETELRELVAQLQESEELRRLTERAGSLGSWAYDPRRDRSRWSRGLRELLGVEPDVEPTPALFVARLHPDDREDFVARFDEQLATGRPSTFRSRIRRPDGTERIVEARGACDLEDGRVVRVYGTTQDVTEQVRRARRIEQVERLLTEAEELAGMGSFETRLPSGDTVLSPGLRRLVGYAADDGEDGAAAGLEVLRGYIHPDDLPRQDAMMARAMAGEALSMVQLRVRSPSGVERLLEISATTYLDAEGSPRRLVGTAVDVTERERLRSERVTLLERTITARDHERRRIAEHLHDDAVQALTATLLRVDHAIATGSTEPLQRARETLVAAVRSLRLNIMHLAPVDLSGDGIEAAVAAYAEQFLDVQGTEIHIDVVLDDEDAIAAESLLASYQAIREALTNVGKHARASTVTVRLRREDDGLVGEVTDDGVGLDPDAPPRAGHLGTQLMRERVEVAGGTVTITPGRDGSGTLVRWRLPL